MTQKLTRSLTPENTGTSLPFNFAAIALLLLMLGVGLAYILDNLANQQNVQPESLYSAPFVEQILGGKNLRIPKAWFHPPAPKSGEFSDQLDLQIKLRFASGDEPTLVDIRLTPASSAQPSAYLLDAVYIKQFLAQQVNGPVGLVGKPLKSEEGFQNETVWYDPLSPTPFVAKCISAVEATQSASCLRTVYLPDQIAVTYQFPAEVLAHWKRFDAVVEPWLFEMGLSSNL